MSQEKNLLSWKVTHNILSSEKGSRSDIYIMTSFLLTTCTEREIERGREGERERQSLEWLQANAICGLSLGDRFKSISIFFCYMYFPIFSTMERNHIYNNFKSYKSELCRLEFSTNMGLQLGFCHCQGKQRNQLLGFAHGAGAAAAKGSIVCACDHWDQCPGARSSRTPTSSSCCSQSAEDAAPKMQIFCRRSKSPLSWVRC